MTKYLDMMRDCVYWIWLLDWSNHHQQFECVMGILDPNHPQRCGTTTQYCDARSTETSIPEIHG